MKILLIIIMQQFLDESILNHDIYGSIMSISHGNNMKTISSGINVENNMHYRIGGQGIPIITTIFLSLVQEGELLLDETVSDYLVNIPNGSLITLEMLCNMTSGLEDYINNPDVITTINTNVHKQWSWNELYTIIFKQTPVYSPGKTFYFGHLTNMLLLQKIMQIRTGKNMEKLLETYIIKPLNLKNTYYAKGETINEPVLNCFTTLRTGYEENATFWNPSWGGDMATAIVSNSYDMNIIARAIGTGQLIKQLYQLQMSFIVPCLNNEYYYGMGVAIGGFGTRYLKTKEYPFNIIWSNQKMHGYNGIWCYIPRHDMAINIICNTVNSNLKANVILQQLFNKFTFDELVKML